MTYTYYNQTIKLSSFYVTIMNLYNCFKHHEEIFIKIIINKILKNKCMKNAPA